MFQIAKNKLVSLINIGVDADLDPKEVRRTCMTNLATLFLGFISVPYVFMFLMVDQIFLSVLSLVYTLVWFLVPTGLNYLKKHQLSRIVFLALFICAIVNFCLTLGTRFVPYMSFFPLLILSVILLGWERKKTIFCFAAISMVGLGVLAVWDPQPLWVMEVSEIQVKIVFFALVFGQYMLSASAIFYLASEHHKFQNLLQGRLNKVESEKEAIAAANTAKSRFLANMSHEIRTPMNGVLISAELLNEESLTENQKKMVNTLTNASKHVVSVINDILDLSRIEAGKMIIENESFDLSEVLKQTVSWFQQESKSKNVVIRSDFPGEKIFIEADKTRINQVVTNLLSNAVKFTENGAVDVKLQELGHGKFQIIVTDTGIGMDEKEVESVFKAFTQADESINRKFGGTGLGLTISKEISKLLGGNLEVSSTKGLGSSFIFLFIAKKATQILKIQPKDIAWKENLHVLLVDDNIVNLELIDQLLRKLGIKADLAKNGSEAIEVYNRCKKENPLDLIFMDCQMPVMDGYKATEIIRQNEGTRKLRIVALTADATEESREHCFSSGMDEYITKPVSKKKLLSALDCFKKAS